MVKRGIIIGVLSAKQRCFIGNEKTNLMEHITNDLHEKGYTILKNVLSKEQCETLIRNYNADNTYRKTITMERYRFGLGEYKYFQYPLPDLITEIRERIY